MANFERLAKSAKNDFLLSKYTREAYAMYAESIVISATCPFDRLMLIRVALTQLLTNLRN
ncbi:hypothetical protein D3C72_2554760 [compost metagenome]